MRAPHPPPPVPTKRDTPLSGQVVKDFQSSLLLFPIGIPPGLGRALEVPVNMPGFAELVQPFLAKFAAGAVSMISSVAGLRTSMTLPDDPVVYSPLIHN